MEKIKLIKTNKGVSYDRSLVDTIDSLPEGKYLVYVVGIEKVSTVPQLKLYWMWMACLEYYSGTPRREWHDLFCNMFLSPMTKSIGEISTKAMSHYMTEIQAHALTEYNVVLPSPEDNEKYNDFVLEFRHR